MPKYEIILDDQDALDAMASEIDRIAATGTTMTEEEYLSDFITTQHRNMREPQLLAAAQAKIEQDPDLKAFRDKKEAERAAAEQARIDTMPPPMPAEKVG